ncbi:MAG: 4-(cytidine 5'-diphospho)-2-C-methyl-D-erythritol kinase [Spirochaetaceae bacterium]|nr:4-(cytidine 5'-diphospho)-2-C-methyl-D-erythritol kinase [Spirochaetaceae bacterium]
MESIFLRLALADTLWFTVVQGRTDRPDCDIRVRWAVPVPGGSGNSLGRPEENIVYKAVSLFRARTGYAETLRVRLYKRIPPGGGLGGGSSDGASALLALNTLAGTALSEGALLEMAACLGSDVPFFLAAGGSGPGSGGAAWVSGRGERICLLDAPRRIRVVLVNPGFSSGTPEAFALLDRVRRGKEGGEGPGPDALIAALGGAPASWPYGNDFLPVLMAEGTAAAKAAYRGILGDFAALGADFWGLSGTGATCFGIFTDKGTAERGVDFLKKRWNFVQLTFPLARSVKAVLK